MPTLLLLKNNGRQVTVPILQRALRRTAWRNEKGRRSFEQRPFYLNQCRDLSLLDLTLAGFFGRSIRRRARFGVRVICFGKGSGITLEHLRHDIDALSLKICLFWRASNGR